MSFEKTNLTFIPEGACQSVTVFPSFTCKITQEPRSPDIGVKAVLDPHQETELLPAYSVKLRDYLNRRLSGKRARIYLGLTTGVSTDGDSVLIELRQQGGGKYACAKILVNILRLLKKCIKADFLSADAGALREIRKDMLARGGIVVFITSRWSHTRVARKVAYIFREFRYRHGCENNNS